MPPRRELAALILVALAAPTLAGCIGGSDPVAPANDTVERESPDGTLPDGRRGIAYDETNRTEEGEGGIEHRHDYWAGRESVILVSTEVSLAALPLFPDGEGSTTSRSVARLDVDGGALVYEGTEAVEILLAPPSDPTYAALLAAASPLSLRYRTASDAEFRDAGAAKPGEALRLDVLPRETDMPHSVASMWAFELVSERADVSRYNVTITALKGSDVAEWPGHPDLWAEQESRVVLDAKATSRVRGIAKALLYGDAADYVRPERIIPHGTGHIDVFVNVTAVRTTNGEKVEGFTLHYHNATVEDGEGDTWVEDEEGGRAFADPYYHFAFNVTDHGMDGPYQDASRWGFRLDAWVGAGVTCSGCFDFEVDYEIKVVAHKRPPEADTEAPQA